MKFGGMGVSDTQKLRVLEGENGRLMRLPADAMLDKAPPHLANRTAAKLTVFPGCTTMT